MNFSILLVCGLVLVLSHPLESIPLQHRAIRSIYNYAPPIFTDQAPALTPVFVKHTNVTLRMLSDGTNSHLLNIDQVSGKRFHFFPICLDILSSPLGNGIFKLKVGWMEKVRQLESSKFQTCSQWGYVVVEHMDDLEDWYRQQREPSAAVKGVGKTLYDYLFSILYWKTGANEREVELGPQHGTLRPHRSVVWNEHQAVVDEAIGRLQVINGKLEDLKSKTN